VQDALGGPSEPRRRWGTDDALLEVQQVLLALARYVLAPSARHEPAAPLECDTRAHPRQVPFAVPRTGRDALVVRSCLVFQILVDLDDLELIMAMNFLASSCSLSWGSRGRSLVQWSDNWLYWDHLVHPSIRRLRWA